MADATVSDKERKTLLRTAETWERMAEWEDRHNPHDRPSDPN